MSMSKKERLLKGETFITSEKGNSMRPLIKSGQNFELTPCTLEECEIGDIVYCKVRKNFYTHLVTKKGDRGVLISNNHGFDNGWTTKVYGKVTNVL